MYVPCCASQSDPQEGHAENWFRFGAPQVKSIRNLRTDKIGRMIAVNGTVTRTSDVRPEMLMGSFKVRPS
jgi:DNA replicative helicase MCM subunit Mcm2 (Cdc46/Mcm family)